MPEGFKTAHGIAWGSRREGLLEISYWNLKRKNSLTGLGQNQIAKLVQAAQKDTNVKAIFIHGGLFYCSGNDLSVLASGNSMTEEEKEESLVLGAEYRMVNLLRVLNRSVKPIVALARGQSIGIGFTMMSLFDFIYCSPETTFSTPFMKSC